MLQDLDLSLVLQTHAAKPDATRAALTMDEQNRETLIRVLRCNALFAGLATNDLETLVEDAEQASCDPGVILFNHGDFADRFFLLLDGRVGLYLGQLEEMACLARIVRPGETVAEAYICGQGSSRLQPKFYPKVP